ncbi:MAG: protein kinase [Microbacteriaceae bacterium]|nr:protein kinase [Microbacteriaceae bacterium]
MDDIGSVNWAAGYRLVRRLGSGRRADVFLGHLPLGSAAVGNAPIGNVAVGNVAVGDVAIGNVAIGNAPIGNAPLGEVASPPGGGGTEQGATAAIKLYRSGTDRSGIDAEIGALARASSPHLVRLADLATAQDGLPVLVLGLLRSQSLAHLLASRGRIESGEAVTILAPIAAAVAELHRVGVAHGGVTAGSVLFDELGTPALASFGRARIIGEEPAGTSASSLSPAELAASAPALRDLADLAALASAVLESTPESAGRTLALSFLRSADPSRAPEQFAADIASVLFDSAPATPVLLGVAPRRLSSQPGALRPRAGSRPRAPSSPHGPSSPHVPLRGLAGPAAAIRSDPAAATTPAPPASLVRGRRRARPPWLDAIHLPEWLEQVIASTVPSRTAGAGAARMLASVRRPVWVAAATVAVLLTAALLLVPNGDASSGLPGAGADPLTLSGGAAPGVPDSPPTGGPAEPVPERSAIAGDDPVAASLALLELRDGCLAALSVLCLDDVDQTGSAAWEADGYLIRQGQEGGGAPARPSPPAGMWEGRSANLVERIGDSALVTVAPPGQTAGEVPVSVLLIKGVEGWRIRDLFVG